MKALRHGLVLLAAAAAPASADDTGLHLIVHGPIDHDAVRSALSTELSLPVTEVLGTCSVPCLDVGVDGTTATLLYSPRNGTARLRTIQLGTDTAQWPTTITLLAGNIVRDEASDILAQLPAEELALPAPATDVVVIPPAPMPAPPRTRREPPVEVEAEHSFLSIGFVPGISTDLSKIGDVRHFLSLDALVGVSAGSSGLTASGLVDVERGRVAGLQLAGISAHARRVSGVQAAGISSTSGDVDGIQLGGIASVADRLDGVQIGGIASVAARADGIQIGGIAAVSAKHASVQVGGIAAVANGSTHTQAGGIASATRGDAGTQVSGIASAATGSAGLQVSGITSVARSANVQVSGIVNVAGELRGIQLAPINVATKVSGVQVGVLNIGGSADGFSFGLINIVPGGRYDLEATVDSSRLGTLLFRHGGRRWHNVYGIAAENVDETGGPADDVWMYGLGFGPSWQTGATTIDLEAICWQVNHGTSHTSELSLLNQLRLSIARDIGPVEIVVGGAINVYVSTDQQSPLITARRVPGAEMETGVSVETWPSAFVGLRL